MQCRVARLGWAAPLGSRYLWERGGREGRDQDGKHSGRLIIKIQDIWLDTRVQWLAGAEWSHHLTGRLQNNLGQAGEFLSKQSAVKNILTFTSVTLTWQWAASVVIRAQLRRDGEQGGERGQPLVGDQQCEGSHSLTDLLISSVFLSSLYRKCPGPLRPITSRRNKSGTPSRLCRTSQESSTWGPRGEKCWTWSSWSPQLLTIPPILSPKVDLTNYITVFLTRYFSGGFKPSKIDAESKWTETVKKVSSPSARHDDEEDRKPKQVLKEVDSILTISASSRSSYKMPPGTSRTRKCQEDYVRETGAK